MSFNQDERRRFTALVHALTERARDIENVRTRKKREQEQLKIESQIRAKVQRRAAEARQREAEEKKRRAIEEENRRRKYAERVRLELENRFLDEACRALRRYDWHAMNRSVLLWLWVTKSQA